MRRPPDFHTGPSSVSPAAADSRAFSLSGAQHALLACDASPAGMEDLLSAALPSATAISCFRGVADVARSFGGVVFRPSARVSGMCVVKFARPKAACRRGLLTFRARAAPRAALAPGLEEARQTATGSRGSRLQQVRCSERNEHAKRLCNCPHARTVLAARRGGGVHRRFGPTARPTAAFFRAVSLSPPTVPSPNNCAVEDARLVLEKWVKAHGGTKVIRKILISNNGREYSRRSPPITPTRLSIFSPLRPRPRRSRRREGHPFDAYVGVPDVPSRRHAHLRRHGHARGRCCQCRVRPCRARAAPPRDPPHWISCALQCVLPAT